MSVESEVFEFLSKCWVPFVAPEHRIYYACGNTRMHDFLRDFKVNSEIDILLLGLGDVRHIMATVAGLSQRPSSTEGKVKEIHFHLNDDDQDVIARDIILLEIMNKLDPENKSDAEFLWSVWYNAFLVEKDFKRLNAVLGDLIDKYSNSSRDSERICKFGDQHYLKSVLKTWNCWLKRKLDQSAVKRSRLKSFEGEGKTMSFSDSNISKHASIQICIDRGIKESEVKTVGNEILSAREGFVNFSEAHKGQNDFVNPTLMRPGCEEWRVQDAGHAAACYLPLQREFLEKYSTVHEACFEKMRETISFYLESWKTTKVTYTFWATDLFHLCHWLLPSDKTFDFIFTSNLMDHVGLLNLLVITQPRLKNSQSVLLTEAHNWTGIYQTLNELFQHEVRCEYMLLPSLFGLRLAEDMDLGSTNLQGFYRTMYARQSDFETIYWIKSFNQENVQIDLEESPEMKLMLTLMVASTFWNKLYTNTTSSVRQTPLAVMYCFQRLQHLIRGGMADLLDYVETLMDDRILDITFNRITWNVVCWAFGLKHQQDRLCMVEIPFKDVNLHLATTKKYAKFSCRLRLDYDTSSNEAYEVLSLFQYDAVSQHFKVPILESAWKALPNHATVSVIGSNSQKPTFLPRELTDQKVQVKKEGKVIATYDQPQQIDSSTTDSVQCLICCEDAEKYQLLTDLSGAASFDSLCHMIVCDSYSRIGVEFINREVVEMPYKFSCVATSCDVKDIGDNRTQAILYKQKSFNMGRTALPFRLIDDSELLPFTCGQDIKTYLEATMICDVMFCSPTDINSRAQAFSGQDLLTDDAFMALRLVIEQLWQLGSKKDKTLNQKIRLAEFQANKESTPRDILILEIEGYYMYESLPFVKLRFTEVDKNHAAADLPSHEAVREEAETVINVKDCGLLRLLVKMLHTNSLRMSQEISANQETNALDESLNSFLQMVFPKDTGESMKLAMHDYPFNSISVNKYIEEIYSASIRENFIVPSKRERIRMKKQMDEMTASLTAAMTQHEIDKKSRTAMPEDSSMATKQELCSECKKSTTDLKKCSRCKTVAYCSKKCQKKDWPRHKKNCSSATPTAETKSRNDDRFVTEPTSEADPQIEGATVLMSRCNSCGVLGTEMKQCSQCKSAN